MVGPAFGAAAMIDMRSTSQVMSRVLLVRPDDVTTFTQRVVPQPVEVEAPLDLGLRLVGTVYEARENINTLTCPVYHWL